ncbi:unnamed protein product [Sphagnum troendelagicum]|uniref:Uncharacterized protein n=1 Tax=Sphagnum troendelagicum TaxID=128251 RepID=A0ABP0TNA5_9BRYO
MAYMAKLKNRGNDRQWCHFRREEDLEVACMVGTMPGLVFCGLSMCSSRGCDMHTECNQAATGKCERLY